jgi:type I restriction enzyme R subunit
MVKEQQIEQNLIAKLEELKYTYRQDINNRATLEQNFHKKFEVLNKVNLTDSEFTRLRDEIITPDVFSAAQALREKGKFIREDGTPLEYMLVNIRDWCKNEFEVINQPRINTENSYHSYDVILLINGLPLVHIELKELGTSPKVAIEQIVEYKNDPGNGYTNSLFCFMQLFIVSNENNTYYFANNQKQHFSFHEAERFLPYYHFADRDNVKIVNLYEFADQFLAKCTLGQMISRYMVLVASEQKLLVMRPYQIYAVKAILDCIHQDRGNGYIWHTTGSGKTLTSFKASTLLKHNPDIEKCFFVVDRKDLDSQTREEFNKFQEGCVDENTNTEKLVQRMLSRDYADKIIVTTIQKLGVALDENGKRNKQHKKQGRQTYKERLESLRNKRMVFIFDECHRSQFGENHQAIVSFFPSSQLFGFTGTPIFDKNATSHKRDGDIASYKTTADIFEKELHAYTITNAIEDKNVLSFHIDYFGKDSAEKPKEGETFPPKAVINAILDKHNSATNDRRFNAILATASIEDAIDYYQLFKRIQLEKQSEDENYLPVNIACVFSPPTNLLPKQDSEVAKQYQEDLPQEAEDNKRQPEKKKQALTDIIANYNQQYGTNYNFNGFGSYYEDVQSRIKDQQYCNADLPHKQKIDITIVVDMLLTGFDAKYLNTLYVDKNLKNHGLIQAFSRTNRVLNNTKPWGNIVDFRYQEKEVDAAIKLFSGGDQSEAAKIWLVEPAPEVIKQYRKALGKLKTFMQGNGLECEPSQVHNLKGDNARAKFVNCFKEVQRLKTQLQQYTDLSAQSKTQIEQYLSSDNFRSFKSAYLDIEKDFRRKRQQGSGGDKTTQELDFELVLFSSALIDYDYIMTLIAKSTQITSKHKMTREQVIEMIRASAELRDECDDIISYINSLPVGKALDEKAIHAGYQDFKDQKTSAALNQIALNHHLTPEALQGFVDSILNRMIFDGEQLTDLLEPLELVWKARREAELALMKELVPHLHKLANQRDISGLAAYEQQ